MIGPGLFRLLMAMVVVLHHSAPLRLGAWAVSVFFVISGFWISAKSVSLQAGIPGLCRFWAERWWRLCPVFLFCSLLAWAMALSGWSPASPPADPAGWWLRQLPVVGSASAGRLLPVVWTLDVEMQFYLVAPFLLAAWHRLPGWGAVLAVAGCFGWSASRAASGIPLDTPRLDLQLAFFLTGAGLQRFGWEPSPRQAWVAAGACVLFFVAAAALPGTRELLWRRGATATDGNLAAGVWWFSACGCLLLLPFLAANLRYASDGRDRWFGQLAYPLFLFHWLPRELYYRWVDWEQPWWHNGILFTGNVIVAMSGAVAIWWLIDRPSEMARRRWMHGGTRVGTGEESR
ncbi:MAG: acyltransferase [Verrucomicrobia bacterium]|nr:acyltransferase [Verrucomicrobiota bacterium]